MSIVTVPFGTNTALRAPYSANVILPPNTGYVRAWVADTVVKVVFGGATVQSDSVISPDDAWLYTSEWNAGEAEASAQRDAGLGTVFNSVEDFLASIPD